MASFNQVPLNQSPVALTGVSISIGTLTVNLGYNFSVIPYVIALGSVGNKNLSEEPAVYPGWRRKTKIT